MQVFFSIFLIKGIHNKAGYELGIEICGLLRHFFAVESHVLYLLDLGGIQDKRALSSSAVHLADGLAFIPCIRQVYLLCHVFLVDAELLFKNKGVKHRHVKRAEGIAALAFRLGNGRKL